MSNLEKFYYFLKENDMYEKFIELIDKKEN